MKKLFISQPMKGRPESEILNERKEIIEKVKKLLNDEIRVLDYSSEELVVLDSYFHDFDGNALGFLGKSLIVLAKADVAAFGKGWENARGCKIEHECCVQYGIPTIEDL